MSKQNNKYDLICIGGGIMSTTYVLMLKLLQPDAKVLILEKLSKNGQESSKTMNNAGTGHSGYCELNYTSEKENGEIDASKALQVCREFELTKEFWSYLVRKGLIDSPSSFLHQSPHCSWVHDKEQVTKLKKRYEEMKKHIEFEDMEYTEDFETMQKWFPLIMKDRKPEEPLAATKVERGTDVNFESLTSQFTKILKDQFDVDFMVDHTVKDLKRQKDCWIVKGKSDEGKFNFETQKIFISAGGGALPLLQKVKIDSDADYGGFPVSGEWLVCTNPELVNQHDTKVYSKASGNNPPMSAPHLDSRHMGDEKLLLFGPFAGFSTKFLKAGSRLDLLKSIKANNISTYLGVFFKTLDLSNYLIKQSLQNKEDKMEELRKFIKDAKPEDWEEQSAGQRVQILKKTKENGACLVFGTEVVSNSDKTVTALLGASPGASTAVNIGLSVLERQYPELFNSDEFTSKLDEMMPFWNKTIEGNEDEYREVRAKTEQNLQITASYQKA